MNLQVPESYFRRLARLYSRMDEAFSRVARLAGFQCRGCEDNCCRSLFYHHTYLEYFYLKQGLQTLDPGRRLALERLALDISARTDEALAAGGPPRLMCPLNEAGRCGLYEYRPMICRLHGIAHRMRLPDGRILRGPGCADFEARCASRGGEVMERTPFYQDMADLEQALRRELGLNRKIRMTVARMISGPDLTAILQEGATL